MTELAGAALGAALADRYRLERELGAGGMATVHLAQDLRHQRRVAIKVLRPELSAALGHERFLREITTTASLRHPHILPLYDSGDAGGFLYYVMPFVEGESLRDRLTREKQLPLEDAIQIAREVADALSYAHARGLVHRDVKPENILLESGHAVVADFGIARAISVAGGEALTQTGMAIGTPLYMSPEQAAADRELDGRSDLYALGCVLYEMLVGEPPYTGPTAQAIMARRLTDPVPPLRTVRSSVPVAVEEAIRRALAKVPADRFATAVQFAEALARPTAAVPPARASATALSARRAVVATVVVALVAALGWLGVRSFGQRPLNLTTANAIQVTSEPGVALHPVLSPDGRQVAFLAVRDWRGALTVRKTDVAVGGGQLRLADPVALQRPVWSPDGESIRFRDCALEGATCTWSEVGNLGGAVRPIDLPRPAREVAWSRTGDRAALVWGDSIFLYAPANHAIRLLATFPARGVHSLAWSPDGRWIAYVAGNPFWITGFNINPSSIWLVDTTGSRVAVPGGQLNVSPAWLDARHLLFVSDREGQREVYVVEIGPAGPRGAPQKVPGGTDAHSISISADGTRMAVARFQAKQNVLVYPLRSSGRLSLRDGRHVTSGTQWVEYLDVSRDGQWLVYDSNLGAGSGGNKRINKLRIDGGEPVPVAAVEGEGPRWSPDGREIAFLDGGIWVVSANGGAATRLTRPDSGRFDAPAQWSPDGLRLAFWSSRSGRLESWLLTRARVGAPWSAPAQLTDFGCAFSSWAPDGSAVLCRLKNGDANTGEAIALVSLSGSVLWRRDLPAGSSSMPVLSQDGSLLYVPQEDGPARGFWAWPVVGGTPRLVLSFDDPLLKAHGYPGAFAIAGDRLYLVVGESQSDIWVMDLKR